MPVCSWRASSSSRVYYGQDDGLSTILSGTIHSQIYELVGAEIVVESGGAQVKSGGGTVSMEQLMVWDPDVILFAGGSIYDSAGEDPAWSGLTSGRRAGGLPRGAGQQLLRLPVGQLIAVEQPEVRLDLPDRVAVEHLRIQQVPQPAHPHDPVGSRWPPQPVVGLRGNLIEPALVQFPCYYEREVYPIMNPFEEIELQDCPCCHGDPPAPAGNKRCFFHHASRTPAAFPAANRQSILPL